MNDEQKGAAQEALTKLKSIDSNTAAVAIFVMVLMLFLWTISKQLDAVIEGVRAMDRRIATIAPASGPPAER